MAGILAVLHRGYSSQVRFYIYDAWTLNVNLSAKMGVGVTCYSLETDPVPIVHEAGMAPGSIWKGVKNLASTGIRLPDRSARSKTLYPNELFWHMTTDIKQK
jgi:hypothetical protein